MSREEFLQPLMLQVRTSTIVKCVLQFKVLFRWKHFSTNTITVSQIILFDIMTHHHFLLQEYWITLIILFIQMLLQGQKPKMFE